MKTFSVKMTALFVTLLIGANAQASIFDYQAAKQIVTDLNHLSTFTCDFPEEFYVGERKFQCVDQANGAIAHMTLRLSGSSPAQNFLVRMTADFSGSVTLANLDAFKTAIANTGLQLFNANPNIGGGTTWSGLIIEDKDGRFHPHYHNPNWRSFKGLMDFSITPMTFEISIYYAG